MSFVLSLALSLALQPAIADDIADGKQALRRSADFPWYDAEGDTLKQVPLQQSAAPGSTQRNSTWNKTSSKSPSSSRPARTGGGTTAAQGDFSLISALFWVFVGLLLVAGVAILVWAFLRREAEDTSQLEGLLTRRNKNDAERIENLPFEIRPRTGDLYEEARQAYANGDYRAAMIFLFSHMLLQMDRTHWIRLSKSKTNRQYLREVKRNRQLAAIFSASMLSFEDVFFGNHDLEKSRFETLWQSMTQFEQLMQQTGVEAT